MSRITEQRRVLRAAVEPLLHDGEAVTVAVAQSDYETGGLTKHRFSVTVTVGPPGKEASAERLDELLSGAVKDALTASELSPTVTRTSGYQTAAGPDGPQLAATWTAQTLD